jgi:hypothetical protein
LAPSTNIKILFWRSPLKPGNLHVNFMKILHVIPSIAAVRGGPSVAVIEIVKNLCLIDGIETSIVTTNDNGDRLLDVPLDDWCEYEGGTVRFSLAHASIREFAIPQLENLGEALLDFTAMADLEQFLSGLE